jgi:hypothetical protein
MVENIHVYMDSILRITDLQGTSTVVNMSNDTEQKTGGPRQVDYGTVHVISTSSSSEYIYLPTVPSL